jgi:hypothetical protein
MSIQLHRPRGPVAAVLVLAACIGLAACGSSSSSSSTAANAAATTAATSSAAAGSAAGSSTSPAPPPAGAPGGPTGATGRYGNFASHFAAVRECLQKNGVTLPQQAPGQGPTGQGPTNQGPTGQGGPGRGGFFGGSTGAQGHLPNGISREQLEAAIKKCGRGTGLRRFGGGFGGRFNDPSYKAALTKFAACMRENGINLPTPNTAGTGPIFNTKGLDSSSPKFTAAEAKCRSLLRGSFRPGAAGPPGAP